MQEPKRKVKSKAAEGRVTKSKKSLKKSLFSSPVTSEPDNTLPDDIFLDSFDKFRINEHQELKTKEVLKKNIRASYNRDSSIENTSDESEASYSIDESATTYSDCEVEHDGSEDIDLTEDESLSISNAQIPVIEENDSPKYKSSHQESAAAYSDWEVGNEDNKDGDPVEEESVFISNAQIPVIEENDSLKYNSAHQDELVGADMHRSVTESSLSFACVQTPFHKTRLTSSTPMTFADKPKLSVKPRGVVFDVEDSVHELSRASKHNRSTDRMQLKGGKWRRTIFEIRKHKITQSPRRTLDKMNEMQSRRSTQQYNGVTLRRKSIYVKDIPDRRTIQSLGQRQSYHNASVLVDAEHSAVESPRHKWVNVQRRFRCISLQPIADDSDESVRSNESADLFASQVTLSDSSCAESLVDEISRLDLGLNRDKLKAQLLKRCGQTAVLPFDEIYSRSVLTNCRKIGEGVFGEVFLNEPTSCLSYVLKVIPIESNLEVNGAVQKRFDEMLQEVIISQELSALRHGNVNCSSGFVEVLNVRLVEGRYPDHLLERWHEYDARRTSDNDCPDVFGDDQLYVVFELANAGTDLEAYCFKNAEQSYSAFKQVAVSLAAAESEFEFEHRDLHWGNVLVAPTAETTLTFNLNGRSIEVRTHGIKATIIDYTLSRLVFNNCCLYQDLATDPELFEASGDYQFDIYRLMKAQTNNVWEVFEPFTNVLWLHYTIDKMINGVRYSATKSVKHRKVIGQMMKTRDGLLKHQGATDYAEADC